MRKQFKEVQCQQVVELGLGSNLFSYKTHAAFCCKLICCSQAGDMNGRSRQKRKKLDFMLHPEKAATTYACPVGE